MDRYFQMIDLAILGLLKEQDLHGYELRKRLSELPGARSGVVSFGSLYPALNRLERSGMVKAVEANTRANRPVPSSGSLAGELAAFRARHRPAHSGRSKKVYGITPQGETQLVALLTDPQPCDDRTFSLRVAFCGFLSSDERLAMFERRRAELLARAAERRRATSGSDGVLDRYRRMLRERDDEALTRDLSWLDRLIAGEQGQAMEEAPS
ncbi:MAG TPA: PadR family transcriptional regulator [Acidimicrobiales bacterium]|nr:PadR family transcriptional regulator [Acidimicrobiales bacterium]